MRPVVISLIRVYFTKNPGSPIFILRSSLVDLNSTASTENTYFAFSENFILHEIFTSGDPKTICVPDPTN